MAPRPGARSHGELQEIFLQVFGQVAFGRIVKKHATKLLTSTKYLPPAPRSQSLILDGQVEQLERTIEREHEAIRSPLRMRTERSFHITADVAELFGQRQRVPSAVRQRRMDRGLCRHRFTSVSTPDEFAPEAPGRRRRACDCHEMAEG